VTHPRDDQSWKAVEERTRAWLDARLRAGIRHVHESRRADPTRVSSVQTAYTFQALQRKLQIFRLLDRLDFTSCVDVGAGWESYPRLIRERYGAAAVYCDFNHPANLPLDGTSSDRLDRAVTANIVRLPFPDQSFDVVLCAEVLEHLVRPVEALAELSRVARKAVILTSLEARVSGRWLRRWLHYRTDVTLPHVERNFFSMAELRFLFGDTAYYESLFDSATLPAGLLASEADQRAAYARMRETDTLVRALCAATAELERLGPGTAGILVCKLVHGSSLARTDVDEAALAAWLVAQAATLEREHYAVLERYREVGEAVKRDHPDLSDDAVTTRAVAVVAPDPRRPVAAALLERLCCPDCRGRLTPSSAGVQCTACAAEFVSEYGVPQLDPKRLPEGSAFEQACVERLCEGDPRRRRGVRRIMRRLRRNERPAGRFRRSIWALADAVDRRR
jgi:SAM-dependent methyltransferase